MLARRLLWGILVVVLAGAVGAYLAFGTRGRHPGALQVYGTVGDFTLTDQEGRTVHRADLDGAPWLADFIFTRCAGPCPLITSQMAGIAATVGPASPLRFVSFSVDPDYDTPAVLAEYAARYHADPARWRFLTGERRTIGALSHDSFHLGLDAPETDSTGFVDIAHSTRLCLVDARGRIRGYYDATDSASVAGLYKDLALVGGLAR